MITTTNIEKLEGLIQIYDKDGRLDFILPIYVNQKHIKFENGKYKIEIEIKD